MSNRIINFPASNSSIDDAIKITVPKVSSIDKSAEIRYTEDSNNDGGASSMDFQKYIDRLDQDRRDMELRYHEDMKRLDTERRLSEERIEKRSKEFEERLEQRFASIDQRFDRIDQRFERIEDKMSTLSTEVHEEGKSTRRWMIGTFMAVASMAVATIIGIVAIVIQFI